MHLLLTDRLTCPRCGPRFGLILLADRIEERRVLEGALGCPNCRERYPVAGGFGDLRAPPRGSDDPGPLDDVEPSEEADDPDGALKLAALLGLRPESGFVLLTGTPVGHAPRLAAMAEGTEIIAAHPGLRGRGETPGVSRIAVGTVLPFLDRSLRGIVLRGREGDELLGEAIRVLAPASRIVHLDPDRESGERMEAEGLTLLLEAESIVVGGSK
jgi:uncharacterized protein YbaR (Trm112 family)